MVVFDREDVFVTIVVTPPLSRMVRQGGLDYRCQGGRSPDQSSRLCRARDRREGELIVGRNSNGILRKNSANGAGWLKMFPRKSRHPLRRAEVSSRCSSKRCF